MPSTLKYEPGTIVADKEFVIVHGRFSGFGQPVNWIATDIVRIANGVLAEHWDVIQDEATPQQSFLHLSDGGPACTDARKES
jgi:predicted SnoaL-like aldol condensation-catalyzing enzyme